MSAVDDIREAAALMRERADLPWVGDKWETTGRYVRRVSTSARITWPAHASAELQLHDPLDERVTNEALAEHMASWHPAVALAVADWLEAFADLHEAAQHRDRPAFGDVAQAHALALTYLGRAS